MVSFSSASKQHRLLSLGLKLATVSLDRQCVCKSMTLKLLKSDPKKCIYVPQ